MQNVIFLDETHLGRGRPSGFRGVASTSTIRFSLLYWLTAFRDCTSQACASYSFRRVLAHSRSPTEIPCAHTAAMKPSFLLVTAGCGPTLSFFDAEKMSNVREANTIGSQVTAIAFSNGTKKVNVDCDPLYLAVAGTSLVAVYDLNDKKMDLGDHEALGSRIQEMPMYSFREHSRPVTAVGFDTRFAQPRFGYSASEDGWLKVWNAELVALRYPGSSATEHQYTKTIAKFRRPGDDDHSLNAAVLYIKPDPEPEPGRIEDVQFNIDGINGANTEFVGNTGEKDSDDDDPDVFITADTKGRISMWGYNKCRLLATVRPHAVFEEDAVKPKEEREGEAEGKNGPKGRGGVSDEGGEIGWRDRAHGLSAVGNTAQTGASTGVVSSVSALDASAAIARCSTPLKARFKTSRAQNTFSQSNTHALKGRESEQEALSIDRYGVPLHTLELFRAADRSGTMLATADAEGNVFIYKVKSMLSGERAPPYAAWSAIEELQCELVPRPTFNPVPKLYVTRTRVSQCGKTLACTMITGTLRVYDLEKDLPRFVAGDSLKMSPYRDCDFSSRMAWDVCFFGDESNRVISCNGVRALMWSLGNDEHDDGHNPSAYPYAYPTRCGVEFLCLAIKTLDYYEDSTSLE